MSRRVCVATCCVLLKPVEFVRELFPAYSPDVVVKVPPWRESDDFTYVYNRWWIIEFVLLQAQDGKKWHIVGRKILSFGEKKTACGGEQRGAWGNAPKSGLIFLLFLPYHWLDQVWWMMEGVRGGWGVDRTCLQSCPSLQNVRKTRDCCVWDTAVCEQRAEEEEGKVDALGQRREGGAGGQRNSKADLKRTIGDSAADLYWKCVFLSFSELFFWRLKQPFWFSVNFTTNILDTVLLYNYIHSKVKKMEI